MVEHTNVSHVYLNYNYCFLYIMTVPAVIYTVWTVGQGCVLRH